MLLIGNGRLVTKNQEQPYFENGAVVIENGIIQEVGEFTALKAKYKDAEFVDAKGKVIMPGMINTHMHIYSAFARGMALDGPVSKNFTDILNNLWWRLDKALTMEDTRYSAYTTLLDCIKTGTTTVFDHHASPYAVEGSLFEIADVAKEIGIRTSLCYEVSDRDGEDILKAGIKENTDFIKHANNGDQDMVKGMFGMHASFTLSDKSLEQCAESMEGLNAGYHVHAAEGTDDLKDALENHGKRVVERLNDFNILGEKTIAVHCIHIDENEMNLLKETKTNVVHNPESNMGNAVGCSPVIKMLEKGIQVGLGTDGYTADMFESIKVGNIIHKHHLADPSVAWGEIPQMQYQNNRNIAGKYFGTQLGLLAEGAAGDVIIVDYDPLTPMTKDNIDSHILFGVCGKSVTHTIVGGKMLMKDREVLCVDEKAIFAKSREVAKNLWGRV